MKKFLAVSLLLLVIVAVGSTQSSALPVSLYITGSWTADDFSAGSLPDSDGEVFGLSAYNGSLTIELLVETDSFFHYDAGYTYTFSGYTYTLAHDWYGYTDVSLAGDSYVFGDATWKSDDILTNLIGVDGLGASLWTDADITTDEITRLSFRIMGSYGNENAVADIFFGSRTGSAISSQFLAWEYYKGDEIRSDSYSVSSTPEPSTILLFATGLASFIVFSNRRERHKEKKRSSLELI